MNWVSVKERLPEKGKSVLVMLQEGACLVARIEPWGWAKGYSAADILDDVTHWMPLPGPPKERTADEKGVIH